MTSNSLKYAELQESKRHNMMQENLTHHQTIENERHNRQQEVLGYSNLSETQVHNRNTEAVNWYSAYADAAYKRNSAAAALQQADARLLDAETNLRRLAESQRHNLAAEGYQSIESGARANLLNQQRATEEHKTEEAFQRAIASKSDTFIRQSEADKAAVDRFTYSFEKAQSIIGNFVGMGANFVRGYETFAK